jgi:hypothetical protein
MLFCVLKVQSGVSLTSSDVKVSEVIEAVTRLVQGDPDLGIQSNAAWMLGHLHLSACAVAANRASGEHLSVWICVLYKNQIGPG